MTFRWWDDKDSWLDDDEVGFKSFKNRAHMLANWNVRPNGTEDLEKRIAELDEEVARLKAENALLRKDLEEARYLSQLF